MKNCKITIPLNGEVNSFDNEAQAASFIRANKRALSLGLNNAPKFSKTVTGSAPQRKVVEELQAMHAKVSFDYGLKVNGKRYIGATKLWDIYQTEFGNRISKFFNVAAWEVNKKNELKQELVDAYCFDKKKPADQLTPEEKKELESLVSSKDAEMNLVIASEKESWDVKAKTGTVWHAIAERFFSQEMSTPDSFQDILKEWSTGDNRITVTPEAMTKFLGELDRFREKLYTTHGRDIVFLPELIITADNPDIQNMYNNAKTPQNPDTIGGIGGILDLVVVDAAGKLHLYDYKTASKPVDSWHEDKQQGIRLQQLLYTKMLTKLGYPVDSSHIFPIIFDELDVPNRSVTKFHVDNVFDINNSQLKYHEKLALSAVMPLGDIITNFNTGDKQLVFELFKDIIDYEPETAGQEWDVDKEVERIIARKSNGSRGYSFIDRSTNKIQYIVVPVGADPATVIKDKIKDAVNAYNESYANFPSRVIKFWERLKEAQRNGDSESSIKYTGEASADVRMGEIIGKYLADGWHIVKDEHAQDLGIVVFYHDRLNMYEFVNITSKNINEPYKGTKGTTLLGNKLKDARAKSMGFSSVTYGDIETLKVYGYLKTNIDQYKNAKIGQIVTVQQAGTRLPNIHSQFTNQLEKQWSTLVTNPYIDSKYRAYNTDMQGEDMFQTVFDRVYMMVTNQVPTSAKKDGKEFYEVFKDVVYDPERYSAVNIQLKIDQLTKLLNGIRRYAEGMNSKALTKDDQITYRMAAQALLELNNLNIALQSDYDKVGNILGTKNTEVTSQQYINHPLFSGVYKLINQTLDATAQRLHASTRGMEKAFEDFFAGTGGTTAIRLGGNPVGRFKEIMEYDNNGRWTGRLKNPASSTMTPAQKELVETIANRIKDTRIAQLTLQGHPDPYSVAELYKYDMPIMKKSISSLLKRNLTDYKEIMKQYTDYLLNENRYFEMDEESKAREAAHIKIINAFEFTEPYNENDKRDQVLAAQEEDLLEDDLQLLFYTFSAASAKQIEGDKRLPLMNAYEVLAKTNSIVQLKDLPNIAKAISDEISFVIFGKRNIEPGSKSIQSTMFAAKKITSGLILGFNFLAYPKEIFQGFLNATSKVLADKAINQGSISMGNLLKAGLLVFNENITTKQLVICDEVNKLFRIVSRSMYEITEKYQIGRKGMVNMENNAYWFYSSPDYMNRMSLCLAQMLQDGVIKMDGGEVAYNSAITITEDGFKYDPYKDDRFSFYLANKKADPETQPEKWYEQRALYEAIKQEHMDEMTPNAIDINGDLKIPYSNKQTMTIRNQADRIYGAADPVNKAAIDRAGITALFTHFKTWAMAKAKRYYMEGDTYESEGHYVNQYDENGKFTGVVWQPKYMEGVIQTAQQMVNTLIETKSLVKTWGELLPEQKQNLLWAANDMMIFALLLLLVGGGIKAARDGEDVSARDLNIFEKYMYKSFEDMNVVNTISAITGGENNPLPTLSFMTSMVSDTWNVVTFQSSPLQLLDNVTAFRISKNIIDTAVND